MNLCYNKDAQLYAGWERPTPLEKGGAADDICDRYTDANDCFCIINGSCYRCSERQKITHPARLK